MISLRLLDDAYASFATIGGAERLVVDAAVGLQNRGHTVSIHTSHHDPTHCFDETKNGECAP